MLLIDIIVKSCLIIFMEQTRLYTVVANKSRRYWKIVYTAALRLGVLIPLENGKFIKVKFKGTQINEQSRKNHNPNNSQLEGSITLGRETFDDIILIESKYGHKRDIITFWPKSDHTDAHKNTTAALVNIAMDGKAYKPEDVIKFMYPEFVRNPGIDPAVLINKFRVSAEVEVVALSKKIAEYQEKESSTDELQLLYEEIKTDNARYEDALKREKERGVEREKLLKDIQNKLAELEGTSESAYASPKKLKSVIPKTNKDGSKTLTLKLGDGTFIESTKQEGFQERRDLANLLINKYIQTDVVIGSDEKKLFQNIKLSTFQGTNKEKGHIVEIAEQYPNSSETNSVPKDRWQKLITNSGHLVWNDTHRLDGKIYQVGDVVKVIWTQKYNGIYAWFTSW